MPLSPSELEDVEAIMIGLRVALGDEGFRRHGPMAVAISRRGPRCGTPSRRNGGKHDA